MNPLPMEITLDIVKALADNDIYSCMKVCRSWYLALSPFYYRDVRVHRDQTIFQRLGMVRIIDGKRIGDFARTLHFYYWNDVDEDSSDEERNISGLTLDEDNLCRLLDLVPHLQTIRFYGGSFASWAHLFKSADIIKKLGHVKDVFVSCSGSYYKSADMIQSDDIVNNAYFKEKITRMHMHNISRFLLQAATNGRYELEYNDNYQDGGSGGDFFVTLFHLNNLEHLEITHTSHMMNYYVRILDTCSSLKSFVFRSTCSCLSLPRGVKHKIHHNLESLKLEVDYSLTYEHLDYIMAYLPNLKELKLSPIFSEGTSSSLFDIQSSNTTNNPRPQKFLSYLSNVSVFEFQEIQKYADSVRTHPHIIHILEESFWKYIYTHLYTKEDEIEDYVCTLDLRIDDDEDDHSVFLFVDRKKRVIRIQLTWSEVKDVDRYLQFSTEPMEFLTFKSIRMKTDFIDLNSTNSYISSNNVLLITPLIRLLKKQKIRTPTSFIPSIVSHYPFISRVRALVLKFVNTDCFNRIKQEQERNRLCTTKHNCGRHEDIVSSIKDSLEEDIIEVNKLDGNIEYLIKQS